jgi:hypothetical protein
MLSYKENRIIALLVCLVLLICWYEQKSWHESHSKIDQSADTRSRKEIPPTSADERIADYTGWLAFLTGALVFGTFIQGYFLLRADKTTRIAANAAALSAKAAIGQKLPVLRCKRPHLWPSPTETHSISFMGTGDPRTTNFIKILELEFKNYGETSAYPREYGLGWILTEKDNAPPPEPIYSDVFSLNRELVITSEFDTGRMTTFCLSLNEASRNKVSNDTAALRLCAYLKYTDFLGDPHEARFCWRWFNGVHGDHLPSGLAVDDTCPESYTRKT